MTSLLKSSMVLRPIMTRKMSDVVKASSGSKFVVTDGKFTKVSQDVTQVHEEITHTGQIFAENDPRRARFIGRKKMVNRNWAVRMAAEEPVIEVDGRKATSDFTTINDGPAALGHPRTYINLDDGKVKTCMYSGKRFVKKKY